MVTSKRPFPIVFFLSVYLLGITLKSPTVARVRPTADSRITIEELRSCAVNEPHWLVITYCIALKCITS